MGYPYLQRLQFWSVPFVSETRRKKYLETVKKDINKDILKIQMKISFLSCIYFCSLVILMKVTIQFNEL